MTLDYRHGNARLHCGQSRSAVDFLEACYIYYVSGMTITTTRGIPWLLLVFSLPTKNASQRVEIWRRLQRYGTLALPSSGYVLPNNPVNQERMEWLAAAIRTYKGQASVVEVQR